MTYRENRRSDKQRTMRRKNERARKYGTTPAPKGAKR